MPSTFYLNISPDNSNPGQATSDQVGKALFAHQGDTLIAQINNSFGAGARMTAINFFVSSGTESNNLPFSRFGIATASTNATVTYPPGDPNAKTLLTVVSNDGGQTLSITDAEGSPPLEDGEHIWYTIEITDASGRVWTLDPEEVNEPESTPTEGEGTPTAADGTQTLGQPGAGAGAGGGMSPMAMPEIVTRNPLTQKPAQKY